MSRFSKKQNLNTGIVNQIPCHWILLTSWSGHPSVRYIPLTSTQGPRLFRPKNPLLRQKSLRHVSNKNSSLRHLTSTTRLFDTSFGQRPKDCQNDVSKWRIFVKVTFWSDLWKWRSSGTENSLLCRVTAVCQSDGYFSVA